MIVLLLAILAPAFTHGELMSNAWKHTEKQVYDEYYLPDIIKLSFSAAVILSIFVSALILSYASPSILNYYLRYLILIFNTVYPINSLSSIFWLSLPPWLCFTAEFPFQLNVVVATVGSLILKYIEFSVVAKMKKDSEVNGSELSEMSIFRSQQMDKVTVPIKLRAISKGISTGWLDVKHKHDNSWWESFGAAQAAQWVQMWLLALAFIMVAALIAGPVHLIAACFTPEGPDHMYIPVFFGMTIACINLWVIWEPLFYILKGNRPRATLRYVEVVVLMTVTAITLTLSSNVVFV
jgi:hypothetical protein